MSEFTKILTHGRRLQGAVKELSISELEDVAAKLANVIENRKQKEKEAEAANAEKQAKLEAIRKQMEEAGLDISDLAGDDAPKKASKAKGSKRPVKYRYTDAQGVEHPWTGIGRMPRVYAELVKAGKSLDTYRV